MRPLLALALAAVLSGTATASAAPGITRCSVELTLSDGEQLTVPAWGATEQEARSHARRWARVIASEHFTQRVWTGLLWADPMAWSGVLELLGRGESGDPLNTPGVTVREAVCEPVGPGSGVGPRWSATWSLGEGDAVVRSDPSTAIEAARRRSCVGAWDAERSAAFRALAAAAPEARVDLWRRALGLAQDGLHGCVTAGLPTLESVQGAETTPPDHPAFQCRAAAETDLGTVHGVAWAGRIERAGEEALTELLYSQARAGLSRALEARVKADLEQQQVLIAAALDATLRRVHAGDLAEQARLTCVGVAEGPLPPLAWHLDTLEDLRDCGERTWLPPVEGVASVEALAGVRDDLCHERAWYGVDLVQDALDSTPAELLGAQASSGWAIVLACEAHCASHTYLAAPGPPVAFEGQPDRSTLAAAQAALMDALVLHDPDLLAQVSPVFGSPRMRELMARQPIAMWLRIPALVELAIADGGIAWVEADGQWTLRETDDGR